MKFMQRCLHARRQQRHALAAEVSNGLLPVDLQRVVVLIENPMVLLAAQTRGRLSPFWNRCRERLSRLDLCRVFKSREHDFENRP